MAVVNLMVLSGETSAFSFCCSASVEVEGGHLVIGRPGGTGGGVGFGSVGSGCRVSAKNSAFSYCSSEESAGV